MDSREFGVGRGIGQVRVKALGPQAQRVPEMEMGSHGWCLLVGRESCVVLRKQLGRMWPQKAVLKEPRLCPPPH